MRPILVDVGSIDHQQIGQLVNAIDQNIIDDTAFAIRQARVLHLAVEEFRHVVRGDTLQEGESLRALDPDLAHMAHVKDTHAVANGSVLVVNARKLDGHIVTRKLGHLGTCCDVILGERSDFHCVINVFYDYFSVVVAVSVAGEAAAGRSRRLSANEGQRLNSFERSNR